MIVTIDGPAGAGKSTAARALATRLGFHFLDTGAMYRAVTWDCLVRGIDLSDEAAVAAAANELDIRFDGDRVFANGAEVTQEIRTTQVTNESRFIAGNNAVRAHLVELQRKIAGGMDIVSEGRDQGTVAFPHAECKFYVTANPQERAKRRQQDLAARGEHVPLEQILAQQVERDARDEQREFGALKPAADAVIVDTSGRPLEDVVQELERLVRKRQKA